MSKGSCQNVALGLDIGGTNIKAVTLDFVGKILEQHHNPSHADISPAAVRDAIRATVRQFTHLHSITSIGIGCAGSVDHERGVVRNSPNFARWKNIPLRQWVAEDFSLPVVVDNDANCAVLAEWKLGAAQGAKNVVLLTLGTGIGGGVVINDQVYRGSTGSAAELGHFSIHADGIWCSCGNRGCFERYCSASALVEKVPGSTARDIMERAVSEPYRSIVSTFIDELSIGITSIANIFDPDVFIIGGAVSLGVVNNLGRLQDFVKKHAFPAVGERMRIGVSKFGHQSGAVGAALLSSNNSFNESLSPLAPNVSC